MFGRKATTYIIKRFELQKEYRYVLCLNIVCSSSNGYVRVKTNVTQNTCYKSNV